LVVQEKKSRKLYLMCDDCESQWDNPESFLTGKGVLADEKNNLESDIDYEEIILAGWGRYIKDIGQ
jgi:hypothetical protein